MMTESSPLILAMDTSTKCSTVAITRGTMVEGEVLGALSLSSSVTHSRRLISCVDQLFREVKTGWQDLDSIAVGLGPGSFTGLRIGLATAKGFAAGSGLPLTGIASIDALAAICTTENQIQAVVDARKKQVYTATYCCERGSFPLKRTSAIEVLSPTQLADRIQEPTLFVGDGIGTYGSFWQERIGGLIRFASAGFNFPSAATIGLLCGSKVIDGDYLDISSASPVYVRASDAELSLADKKKTAKKDGEKT